MVVTAVVQVPSHELPAPLYLPTEVELPMQLHLRSIFLIFFHLNIFLLLSEWRAIDNIYPGGASELLSAEIIVHLLLFPY